MIPAMVSVGTVDHLRPDGALNASFNHSMTTLSDGLNQSSQKILLEIMAEYYPVAFQINRLFPIFCYVIGFFGNTISAVAWFQPRLSKRNSSSVYLALLSVFNLFFLVLHCADHIDALLGRSLPQQMLYCEIFFFLYLIPQYMTPLLVLGFTTERYVAACYPLLRRVLCRTRAAISISVGMVAISVFLASMYPLFWTYSPKVRYCGMRQSIPNLNSVWLVWSLIVDVFMFLAVPSVILVMDILVIRCLCQINKNPLSSIRGRGLPCATKLNKIGENRDRREGGGVGGKMGGKRADNIQVSLVKTLNDEAVQGKGGNGGWIGTEGGGVGGHSVAVRPRLGAIRVPYQATTAMLLTVSLFEVVTIMLVTILYLLHDYFGRGSSGLSKEEMLADPTWRRYFPYLATKYTIIPLCMTRNAGQVFFYLALGPRFRETLWDLIRCRK